MNRFLIDVDKITLVLASYDQLKVYRAAGEDGSYSEITDETSRIDLVAEQTKYEFTDPSGTTDHWYKVAYYNSSTTAESAKSDARLGGTEYDKIGHSFGNYAPPTGEWGKVLTPDDMRFTWLFGIDSIANDVAQTEWTDEQFDFMVDVAMADFERLLTMDIRKHVYKTNVSERNPSLVRSQDGKWRSNVDYTDGDDPYDFDPKQWQNYGYLQLRHFPIISVERAKLYSPLSGEILDFVDQDWIRVEKALGQLYFFPKSGISYGPYSINAMPWILLGARYPSAFEIDYTTGYENAMLVPQDLRGVIGKWAAIKCLAMIGDGLLAGFSSQSVSLDGLSESFSSTQSATSAYFGARIAHYTKEIEEWLKRSRYKYAPIPIGWVGV